MNDRCTANHSEHGQCVFDAGHDGLHAASRDGKTKFHRWAGTMPPAPAGPPVCGGCGLMVCACPREVDVGRDVTHPAYYAALSPEPLDVAVAWGLSYPAGCVLKYLARHGRKPGASALDDLLKARAYLNRMIAEVSK